MCEGRQLRSWTGPSPTRSGEERRAPVTGSALSLVPAGRRRIRVSTRSTLPALMSLVKGSRSTRGTRLRVRICAVEAASSLSAGDRPHRGLGPRGVGRARRRRRQRGPNGRDARLGRRVSRSSTPRRASAGGRRRGLGANVHQRRTRGQKVRRCRGRLGVSYLPTQMRAIQASSAPLGLVPFPLKITAPVLVVTPVTPVRVHPAGTVTLLAGSRALS